MGILTTILNPKKNLLRTSKRSKHQILSDDSHAKMYNSFFEQHPDAIYTLDLNGNILSSNHSVESFIGYQSNEMTGNFTRFIKKEYVEDVIKHYQLAVKGFTQNYHCEVIHKNGHFVHVDITNIPIGKNGVITDIIGYAKNLTNLYQKEDELLKITNSLNLAQEVAMLGSWDYDVNTDYVYCSDALFRILGIKDHTNMVPYQNLLEMICSDDRIIFDYHFQQSKMSGEIMDHVYKIRKPDNTIITVHTKAEAKKDANGKVNRLIGVLQDVSDIVLTENKLKESEEKFGNIAKNLDIGIWSIDYLSKQIVYVSPGLEKFTGYEPEDFLSGKRVWKEMIHYEDLENYSKLQMDLLKGEMIQQQYRIITSEGKVKWVEDRTFPKLNSDGALVRLDGHVQDISERKIYEEKINTFAYHDYLTELPNRRMFEKKLEDLATRHRKSDEQFALFYLDMDRFKFVNDTLGHEIGDDLLQLISTRLTSLLSDNDLLFRIGGDEFAIILSQFSSSKDPVDFGKEIIEGIEKPFNIYGYDIHITTSVGIGIFPEDGETIKELKMNTDAALYRAKELGKNTVQLFTKSLNIESYKLFTLENDLRKAIQKDELILHYQPRVDALTGEIVGAEALIRWNHSKWGLVSPNEFIPLAEESGLINDIGDWVIQQVCKQMMEWKIKGCSIVPISINLSAKTLMKADLVSTIVKNLTQFKIHPSLLEIEITEDSIIKNEVSVLSTIQSLQDLGISISLDDFGTGYSSIGYLKKFKVDYLKIDRSFIKDLLENPGDSAIVQSIILLAKGFQLKVVAEGVETEEQWQVLKELNCHFIQGYLFSKPLEANQFSKLLSLEDKNIQPIKVETILPIENRPKYNRLNLPIPKEAGMTIIKIKDESVKIGKSNVFILNIGQDGFSFSSKLNLPITNEIILQFEVKVLGETLILKGYTAWKEELGDNELHYGLKFQMKESEKKKLRLKIKEGISLYKKSRYR